MDKASKPKLQVNVPSNVAAGTPTKSLALVVEDDSKPISLKDIGSYQFASVVLRPPLSSF